MVDFMASEEDIVTILQSPLSNVISDSTYPTDGMLHPRVYGTFVHLLEHFVKERGVLTTEQAVHKMTQKAGPGSAPCRKGRPGPGYGRGHQRLCPGKAASARHLRKPLRSGPGHGLCAGGRRRGRGKGKYTGVKAGRILKRA